MNPYSNVLREYFESKRWLYSPREQGDLSVIPLEVPGELSGTKYPVTVLVRDRYAKVILDTGINFQSSNGRGGFICEALKADPRTCYFVRSGDFFVTTVVLPGLSIYQIEAAIQDVVDTAEFLLDVMLETSISIPS